MSAANHGERIGAGKVARAGEFGDRFLAGVNQVGVFLAFQRVRANAEHAVLGLEHDVDVGRYEIRHQRGHADAEIDVIAVAQFERGAPDDPMRSPVIQCRTVLRSMRRSYFSP